jgi:methylase of polypeptide subunit release factors
MDIVQRLLEQAKSRLLPDGGILLEMDSSQSRVLCQLSLQHFPDARVSVEKDLAGLERILLVRTC